MNRATIDAEWRDETIEYHLVPDLFDHLSELGFKYTLIDDHNWIYKINVPNLLSMKFSNWLSSISSLFTKNPFTKITLNNSLHYFHNKNLKRLPWCPNVTKDFNCHFNQLTSLVGSPKEVGGHFNCVGNLITSLKESPKKVGGDFLCQKNPNLKSLKGLENSYITGIIKYDINNMSNPEEAEAIVKKVTGKN